MTVNFNPLKGVANGSFATLRALTVNPDQLVDVLAQTVARWSDGDGYITIEPPYAIHLEIQSPSEMIIPIKISNTCSTLNIGKKTCRTYFEHPVSLAFSITFHKCQGLTVDALIFDLNKRKKSPHINYHMLYVGLSRTRSSENIRLLPAHPGTTFDYLNSLKPPEKLVTFLNRL